MANWARVNVAGVTHDGRQTVIRKHCSAGDPAELRREPDNAFDRNAIAVYVRGRQIGYVPADVAETIAPGLDSGLLTLTAKVYKVGSFETDGRDRRGRFSFRQPETIWSATLDIHWRHAKPADESPGRKPGRTRERRRTPGRKPELAQPILAGTVAEPARKPPPVPAPPGRDALKEIGQALLSTGRAGMRAARAAVLKADSGLRRLAGDDPTFLWILRFVALALLAAVALLLAL